MSKQTVEKISIKGVPPTWQDEEFQRRLDMELHKYRNTADSTEIIRSSLEHDWLNTIISKATEGYTVNARYPIKHDLFSHVVNMNKPEEMQSADIEKLRLKVKHGYVEHLQQERQRYQDLLRKQLIQAQEERERAQREKEEVKRLAAIDREIAECFGELVVPDGVPEPKPAEFSMELS